VVGLHEARVPVPPLGWVPLARFASVLSASNESTLGMQRSR
jgi:hypothetical protein